MRHDDARILLRLALGQPRSGSHGERLARFYAPQAAAYDRFRERLLPDRDELIRRLAPPPGGRVVELGAGTGQNLRWFGTHLKTLARVDLVDLCQPLLEIAERRASSYANVHISNADASTYRPEQPVDCVYFAYALTMIPQWQAAIDNAVSMLKPGGRLGVIDFQVETGQHRLGRWFWRHWFRHDGVHLDSAHLQYLSTQLPEHWCSERRAALPYLPGLRAPYYLFVGSKPHACA